MSPIFETVAQHWKGGGFACTDRDLPGVRDRSRHRPHPGALLLRQRGQGTVPARAEDHIFNGDLDKAISYTAGQKATPLTNIVKAA